MVILLITEKTIIRTIRFILFRFEISSILHRDGNQIPAVRHHSVAYMKLIRLNALLHSGPHLHALGNVQLGTVFDGKGLWLLW